MNNHLGLLVQKNNLIELSTAMLNMYSTKYENKPIRDYCINTFSKDIIIFKLENIYRGIQYKNIKGLMK